MKISKTRKTIRKIFLFGFALIFVFSVFKPLTRAFCPKNLDKPGVIFFDVGQGDAILIKTPDKKTILLDGGPDNLVLWRLGEFLPFYRRRIDWLIFSHYHDDHIAGLVEVLRRYRVANILYAPTEFSSPILEAFLAAAKAEEANIQLLSATARLEFGSDCFMDMINPESLGIKKDENNSIYARLDCREQSFLFTGDSDFRAEKALLSSGWPLEADVLKAAHHGSKTGNSAIFLEAVGADIFVVSAGADNKFNHPHPEILERAEGFGLKIRRTDMEGSIFFDLE
ncbi:MAG: MBL fold metallo-hydrolase [Patescibacteria group bacterium]